MVTYFKELDCQRGCHDSESFDLESIDARLVEEEFVDAEIQPEWRASLPQPGKGRFADNLEIYPDSLARARNRLVGASTR
jgi:hypothetical protein